ncbi:nucleotidyltransferase domain-containing protein [Halomonas llamarensis]|uniref:Nucleotidyltransferase domain-containing protein n=1 Tax=Halomonas llamarensis TaxID=2945104 RepID=A0ABT0SR07_9GAMM|nr:nucleotidyltransferase domain-containing protein [Halomonas llamarensis]MCL7929900.1 nucleotidyltransferase domain-containing protein [Halomonas llamarensis]
MRITQTHRAIILSGVEEYIDADVDVRVFGSRLDDTKQGGGVDLLLISQTNIPPQACAELNEVLEEYLKLPVNIETYTSTDEPTPTQARVLAEACPIDDKNT